VWFLPLTGKKMDKKRGEKFQMRPQKFSGKRGEGEEGKKRGGGRRGHNCKPVIYLPPIKKRGKKKKKEEKRESGEV